VKPNLDRDRHFGRASMKKKAKKGKAKSGRKASAKGKKAATAKGSDEMKV
jgi:hypothetical protein